MASPFLRTVIGQPGASGAAIVDADPPPPMTEVDLLPAWYPSLVRRRRWLIVQVWATAALFVVLATVLILRREDVAATEVELAQLEEQRRATDAVLSELAIQQARMARLGAQASAIERAGLPLEVSRLLSLVAQGAPESMALTEITAKTEVLNARPFTASGAAAANTPSPPPRRVLRMSVKGVAADARGAMNLYDHLVQHAQETRLLSDVRLLGTQSGTLHGRNIVAFEITFQVDLSTGDEGAGGPLAGTGGGR